MMIWESNKQYGLDWIACEKSSCGSLIMEECVVVRKSVDFHFGKICNM
jgi:hypothetical protein